MDLEYKRTDGLIDLQSTLAFKRDSSLLKSGVLGLLDGLAESPRFEAFEIKSPRVLYGSNSDLEKSLSWDLVGKLAQKDSLDMLISLTSANFTDTIMNFEFREGFSISYVLYPRVYWRLYNLRERKITQYIYKDTLAYLTGINNSYPPISKIIKNFNNALGVAGYAFSRELAPFWELEERDWFPSGNNSMDMAGKLAGDGQWAEASEIWRELAYSNNRSQAAKASFNMAVASEMMDRLDLGIEWLNRSKQLGLGYYTYFYRKILEQRQKLQPLLEFQMK